LVRVLRTGICGTDLHAYRGKQPFFTYPRILGHELGVEVIALGAGTEAAVAPGDVCCVEPFLNCGKCPACRRGKTNCCESLKTLGVHTDGAMQERYVLPAHKLHKSPGLRPEQLATVEPLCIGSHAGLARAAGSGRFAAGDWGGADRAGGGGSVASIGYRAGDDGGEFEPAGVLREAGEAAHRGRAAGCQRNNCGRCSTESCRG
jgi:D-arabinose 1-dehydrogenase-like Zn-dependent alcohol dehydrogenase